MTNVKTLKTIALTAALGLSALVTSMSGAQAMTLHNCTDWNLPVHLQDKNGDTSRRTYLTPQQSARVHATSSYGPYRIILPTLGQGAHFSGRSGDGTFSLITTGGGNIGIRNGYACPKPVSQPRNSGGSSELCLSDGKFNLCIRP